MEEKPVGKKTLWRPRLGCENVVGKDEKSLNGGPDWKA